MSDTTKYRPCDVWPLDQAGAEGATLVLVCYCGGHVDAAGGTCEMCGRVFDDRGRRLVDAEDLDPETGELIPMPADLT